MCCNANGFVGAGSGSITPADLTTAYPYEQTYFPAEALTGGQAVGDTPGYEIFLIPGQRQTYPLWSFAPSASEYIFFTVGFIRKENDTTPEFAIYPEWMQTDDVTAPVNNNVVWASTITNKTKGSSLSFDSTLNQVQMTAEAEDRYVVAGGSTTDVNEALGNDTINGDALSSTNLNFLTFTLIRRGDLGADNYLNPAKLLGLTLQWKTDFGNIAQLPRDIT